MGFIGGGTENSLLKITELTASTSIVSTDLIPVVKDPQGTPSTQKITLANFKTSLSLAKATVTVHNHTPTITASEAPVLQFVIIKGVSA